LNFRANLQELKFDFIISFPVLDIRGQYDLIFQLFGLSLKGKGELIAQFGMRNSWSQLMRTRPLFFKNLSTAGMRARISMRARPYSRNGQTFLNFEKFLIKIIPGRNNIKLTNLFQGNPGLEEIGNAFINGNSDFFLTEIYPSLESQLSEIFTNIANKITGEASYDELFPNF
jgi:hypothetical protein